MDSQNPSWFDGRFRIGMRSIRWKLRSVSRNFLACSLRLKITVALAVALCVVIGIYTYLMLRMQANWNRDRLQAAHSIVALSVQEQFTRSLLSDSSLKGHPPKLLQSQPNWPRIWVLDEEQKILSSTMKQSVGRPWDPTLADPKVTTVTHLRNLQECQSCHGDNKPHLARIMIASEESQLAQAESFQMRWLVVYGMLMTFLILLGMAFCLIRFVKQPLTHLVGLMRRVQSGDLNVRFRIRGKDEVAQLGHGFNRMIRSLAKARRSLQTAHERQIQQAEKLASIGELASGLAHEIRNPLAGIKTAVQVLAEKIASRNGHGENSDLQEIVAEVSTQVERVNRLIGDLLQYVRPKAPLTLPRDICELIEKCLCLIRPQAEKLRVTIAWKCLSDDCLVCADAGQIQQAILNLSLNALQAMPQGGTLSLSLTKDSPSGCVLLHIADTGIGMTEEAQQRVFSPFFTTKPQGTGLGLSITGGIIQRHGGGLEFKSKLKEGTIFTIRLPLLKAHGCPKTPNEKFDGVACGCRNARMSAISPSLHRSFQRNV